MTSVKAFIKTHLMLYVVVVKLYSPDATRTTQIKPKQTRQSNVNTIIPPLYLYSDMQQDLDVYTVYFIYMYIYQF